jgi:tetratricopeptide (TPR) repeat protein
LRDIIAIHFDNKEYKQTLPLIDALEKKDDQAFAALYFRGMAFEALEQYDKALTSYRAIRPDEYNSTSIIDIQIRIAIVLKKYKGFDVALKHVRKQQKKSQSDKPFLAELYVLESDLYHSAKQYKKALEANKKAAKLLPQNSKILYSQALLYESLEDISSSEQVLKAILSFDKKNSSAMNALGYLLTDHTTRFDEALVYIQLAYRLQPTDPMIIDSLGWIYFKMGKISKAEKYLRQAYKLRQDIEIVAHLIELLIKKGAQDEAEALLEKMLKKNPDDKILLRIKKKL